MENKTQEDILKENGGVMTSESSRGSLYEEDMIGKEMEEILTDGNKYSLNSDI